MTATGNIDVNAITTAIIDSKFEAGNDVILANSEEIVSTIISADNNATIETAKFMTDVTINAEGKVDATATYFNGLTVDAGDAATVMATDGDIVNSNIWGLDVTATAEAINGLSVAAERDASLSSCRCC